MCPVEFVNIIHRIILTVMISEERKAWIKSNRSRGDITTAVGSLNKKGVSITVAQANQVVFNDILGKYGNQVWDELEKVIRKRQSQLLKEKQKYANSQ